MGLLEWIASRTAEQWSAFAATAAFMTSVFSGWIALRSYRQQRPNIQVQAQHWKLVDGESINFSVINAGLMPAHVEEVRIYRQRGWWVFSYAAYNFTVGIPRFFGTRINPYEAIYRDLPIEVLRLGDHPEAEHRETVWRVAVRISGVRNVKHSDWVKIPPRQRTVLHSPGSDAPQVVQSSHPAS